ncbi:Putative GTP-binding protein [Escherichia coli]|nr:Putative GTP-binding protein [Escherichia coli]
MGYGRHSAFSRTGTEHSVRKRRRYSGCSGPYIRLWPYRPAPAWELDTLVSALDDSASRPCRQSLMTRLQDELRESVRSQAREQFTGAVDRIFDTASVCVASVARTVLRAVRDTVVSVARAVWNWIFF